LQTYVASKSQQNLCFTQILDDITQAFDALHKDLKHCPIDLDKACFFFQQLLH
jgi:hypothetical protein